MTRWVFAIVLLVPFHFQLAAQAVQEAAACDDKPQVIVKLEKPNADWDVSMVDRTHKVMADQSAATYGASLVDVVRSKYALRGKYFSFTQVVLYPCQHSVSLRSEQLAVSEAYGYSLHGQTFALSLTGYWDCGNRLEEKKWVSAGCSTAMTLTDTSGSGTFDMLRIGKESPEFVPQWVEK
jgi:hypothetical protein